MKIAIDGAQSTGKTTLFNELKNAPELNSFRFIPEASRSIAHEFGIATTEDWVALLNNPTELNRFFQREEEWLVNEIQDSDHFIVDSSHYLIQAYKISLLKIESLLPCNSMAYDLMLYCPCTNERQNDGFRFLDGRETVDQTYRNLIPKLPTLQFIELPIGQSRFHTALTAVTKLLFEM